MASSADTTERSSKLFCPFSYILIISNVFIYRVSQMRIFLKFYIFGVSHKLRLQLLIHTLIWLLFGGLKSNFTDIFLLNLRKSELDPLVFRWCFKRKLYLLKFQCEDFVGFHEGITLH